MIRRFFAALMLAALLSGGAPAGSAEEILPLVRLHVLAQDDTPEAQAFKLEIRDECLRCAQAYLADAPDADAAYMRLNEHLEDFERACARRARELGSEVGIRAEIGTFEFPDRVYGNVLVPAGSYRALRVRIGSGRGQNWWCVLYPSLCLSEAADGEDAPPLVEWLRVRLGVDA